MLDCALGPAINECVATPLAVGGAGLHGPQHRKSARPQPMVVVRAVIAELPSPLFLDPAGGEGALTASLEHWVTLVGDHVPADQIDMRTIEHSLCEWDKYERVRLGQGKPRSKFTQSSEPLPQGVVQ